MMNLFSLKTLTNKVIISAVALSFSINASAECEHTKYGVPAYSDIAICYEGYAMAYDYQLKAAVWVSYSLDKQIGQGVDRQDDFRINNDIPAIYATTPDDYVEPVYDMGHLANSESVDLTINANSETFLMSNMTPQLPGHNRAIWKGLESRERKWANKYGNVFVIAGAIYEPGYKTIGNDVPVPTQYWKIIYRTDKPSAIAFLIPHKKLSTKLLNNYIVSVDTLETVTGYNFLETLPDDIENSIEQVTFKAQW